MIRCDCGVVEFDGSGAQLLSELSTLIRALLQAGLGNVDLMHTVVESACISEEELDMIVKVSSNDVNNLLSYVDAITHQKRVNEMMEVVNRLKKKGE